MRIREIKKYIFSVNLIEINAMK